MTRLVECFNSGKRKVDVFTASVMKQSATESMKSGFPWRTVAFCPNSLARANKALLFPQVSNCWWRCSTVFLERSVKLLDCCKKAIFWEFLQVCRKDPLVHSVKTYFVLRRGDSLSGCSAEHRVSLLMVIVGLLGTGPCDKIRLSGSTLYILQALCQFPLWIESTSGVT